MAFTVSNLANSVFGNKRIVFLRVTADGATDSIVSGLGVIDALVACAQSATTGAGKFKMNILSAGTAANGNVAITGVASGDVFFVQCVGR